MTVLIRVIDLETTGLDPTIDRIVEVATVDVAVLDKVTQTDGQTARELKVERGAMWSTLVNPDMPIPAQASGVHDITDEMVKNAPKIADVVPQILSTRTEGKTVDYLCAHNNRFDMGFYRPKDLLWIDTYRVALYLWPNAPSHKNNALRYWLSLNLVKDLPDIRARSHSALWDTYVTAALLRRALGRMTIEEMLKVSSEPAILPKLGFGEHAMLPIAEVPASYLQWILDKFEASKEDVRHTAKIELQRRRGSVRVGDHETYPTGPVSSKYDGPGDISMGD